MKTLYGTLLVSIVLSGCTAHMMETHGDTVQLFKLKNDKPGKGGVLRFLNTGLKSFKEARRKNAISQIEKFCKGPYQITAEGPRSQFGASMPIGKSVSFEVDEYTYLAFECETK